MNKEYIDKIVSETHKNMELKKINDNLYLSNKQIDILDRYDIPYKNKNIDELLFDIDDILNNSYEDLAELEDLSKELAEFNYYHNTKK